MMARTQINHIKWQDAIGCDPSFKWMVDMTSGSETSAIFPGERGKYRLGLREIYITDCGQNWDCLFLCTSPTVSVPTYVKNNAVVSSVKSLFVQGSDNVKNFSNSMELFVIDLYHTDRIAFGFKDINGDYVAAKAVCVFDVFEII